jgi:hypothetical protein
VTTWDFRGTQWRASLGNKSSKGKSVTLMELKQRHVIKFLHIKSLKLNEIATEFSNTYGRDA